MPTDKIDQIYNAMSADGASMPSRQSFRKKMLAPGAEGYKNRKAFYDAMVADGANLGGSYEAFAKKIGLHAVKPAPAPAQAAALQRPVQNMKQNAGKSSATQYKRAQLSDMLGNTMDQTADALHPKPVGYALSQEHRDEVLGKQAEVSTNQSNPHVQRARMQGHVAGFKREVREGRKYGRPGLARAVGDAINGDEKALKGTGLPQVMQQKKDELDYSMATGKQLRNPVDAGLTYDENGNVVHSMFAPTVARDGDGNMLAGDDGKPIIGISTDKARAEAYGDAVQADIESQRKREATKNLYKAAVKSVDEAFNEKYEKEESYRKEHPFLGMVRQALEGFGGSSAVGGGNVFQYVPEEAKAGMAAVGMLTKAQRMKNDADRYGDAGMLSRLYGGIMAGLTDVSTYDFGITDTFNATALYQAAKNYESGKASAKDKMLLDAAALAGSMQAEASDKLGGAYGAGQNLIGTLGFMMQFYNNPASGSGKAIASKVAGTVARRAIEKFGKGAVAKAVTMLGKGAARVGMDAAEAAVVTGMYSPTKIVGDYLDRKTGDVQRDGKGGYIFQNREYSSGKALAKAINGQYAENLSEMWGEYLPGVGKVNAAMERGARKVGLGKVVDAFEHMSTSDWAKTWKRFQERTKWNGMAGEYFEEVANNLYNAVTNGDMTLDTDPHTGVFNPQINRDTFYSVALMSGMMSAVQTAGYARERFRAPHLRKKADAQARSVFGDRWNDYKEAIDNADEKQIGKVMEKIGNDRSLSNSQKIAALQYQFRTAVVHGVNAQDVKNKLEGRFNAMDEAYAMGYDAQSDRELNNTAILYDEAKKKAVKSTGWNEAELERMIGDDGGVKALGHMLNDRGKFSPEQLQAVTDYANARAAYHGMIQRVQDDIDSRVQESDLEADRRTNAVTDSIHPATMKVGNRKVYVVNGIVSMLPDGGGVDHEHSDDFLVIRDAETGELETAEPSAILSVDAPIDPVQEKTDAAANIRQAYAQQEADRIDGKLAFSPGDTYSVAGDDGERHTLYIIGDAVDEKTGQPIPDMVTATVDSGQQTVLSKEQVQRQVNEARRAAVAETQRRTPQQDSPFDYNDDIVLTDEAGRTVRGTITTGRNDDGRYEVYTEDPVNGKHVNLFSDEDLSAFHARKQGQEASPETEAVAQPVLQGTAAGEVQTADAGERQGNTEAAEETPQAEGTALERIPKDGNGQPLLEQTDPETAWDGVVEYMEDAGDAKEYVGSMVARLSKEAEAAAKAVGRIKPTGDMAQFKADKAAARQTQAAAEARLEHWKNIADVQNKREYAAQAAEQKERAEREAEIRRQAVEEEKQRQQEELQKQAEQEERGSNSVAPAIREKWDASPKVDGAPNEIVLPDGERVSGHYVLTESGAASPSHNAAAEFAKTEGFPVDGNGQSVNDRDYERDRDAQAVTRSIARNYDSRALQSPVVVSRDGVVLSGNGRTMAGDLAAADNTDGAYIGHLQKYPQQFGFTPEQVKGMKHPRVVFVPDADLPYTAETFAKFNQQEMKGQSKTEQAVKLGKVVDDRTFAHITRSINGYDTLGEFYADHKATHAAIKELQASGVLSHAQMAEMFDGDGISAQGREILENMLIGKAFESNPDAIREITAFKSVRQSVITALSEIVNNKSLGAYSLEDELAQAVDLVYKARKAGHRSGDRVSSFARQQNLFSFDEGDTVADYNNATMLMLADVLNDSRITQLKKILSVYNQKAADSAAGQTDMFSGGVKTKEEIWNEVKQLINHGTEEEQQKAVREAAERRKESVLQDEPSGRGDEGSGEVGWSASEVQNEQSATDSTLREEEKSDNPATPNGNVPNTSFGKDSKESDTKQEKPEKFVPSAKKVGENILDYAARVAEEHHAHKVRKAEEAKVDTHPTEAQKESGNYKKGHIRVDGLDITIEQPKGSIRRGKDANGKEWESEMHSTYGYIRGTKGTDGDHIDVYLSDNPTAGNVYIVDQIDQQTGEFDEHKVMYGFGSMEEAVQAYRDQYEDGWKTGNVTEVSREEFKKWVDSSTRKTKPFADYKTVKPLDTERTQSDGNYAHNPEEIMRDDDVKPVDSPENYTITPTQYTNRKGKTSDMYLVKFNHELNKEEKAAAKAFVGEPLAEGRRTPRGWYDREQRGYMVRSEEAARQLGNMMADEVAVADEQPLTVQDYRNAAAPAVHKEQEKKPSNTVSVEDAAIQDVEAVVHSPEHKDSGLDFNGDVSKEDFNDALKDLRSLLGVSDDEGDVGILFRDSDELTKEQRKKIKAAGLSVTQVLVDNGMVRFSDYANKMVSLIGDKIRPWLKSFYEGIRWEPGYESVDFTPSDEVARFDVQNFDKPSPDILKQAEMVVAEQKAAKISKQTEQEVKTERNEKRKEYEKQTEADTAAIAEEAGTVASEARAVAERATTDTEVRNATEKVDATLEKVNNQLALLGYYEADKVEKDFNEAYGYMRNAEKKAVKDATTLAKRIADDLGVDMYDATHTAPGKGGKRKSKPLATANIAPIGGDITIHLPLADGMDLSIYINLKTTSAKGGFVQGDNLEVGNIMYRIENPNATGHERYGRNNFAAPDITYDRLRDDISRVIDHAVRETPQPKKVNVESLVRELQEKGRARLREHTEEVKKAEAHKGSDSDIKSYLADLINSIAENKSIRQIVNPATGNSEEVIRISVAKGLHDFVLDNYTDYSDPKVKALLDHVIGDKSLSKEENRRKLDRIVDAVIARTRSVLKKNANEAETAHESDLADKVFQPAVGLPANSKVLAQYDALKEKHPDAKLLFRVGDFYEAYQDDAEDVSKVLSVVLSKRDDGIKMAGFPYHALDTYLPKLIRAGYRVALCDQKDTAKEAFATDGLNGRFTSAEDIAGVFGKTFVNNETGSEIKVGEFTSPYKIAIERDGEFSVEEWRHVAETLNGEEWQEKVVPDLHGFSIGDKVMYKGKEATLCDIDKADNNRPLLDTGSAPVMYEAASWEELSPVTDSGEAVPAEKEKVPTRKEKPAKKNSPKKKSVSLKREPTVGDLFGDLFDNNDSDSKDNDTARTRQAEGSSREDGTVGRISAERDGVLDTRSAGGTDGGGTAGVPDTAGTVADGERKDVSGQRGGGSAPGGNHGDGEIAGRLPYGGRGFRNGAPAAGRNGLRGSAAASAGVQEKTGSGGEGVRHGMQADGRPSSDPGGDGLYTPAAERPSSSGTAGNRREVQGGGRRELEPEFKRNYLYPENSSEIDNMTPQQRLRSNVEALEVVRTLMKEGREATADEREILGRYRGWGGVDLGRAYSTDMMRRSFTDRWGTPTEQGKLISRLADIIDELDPNGERGVLSAINRAALTSYYTPTAVARVMNGFVEQAGFKGGSMLDPSMGSGIFEGTMSKAVQQRTMIHGIELDWLTGQIARNLYPDANVLVTGYEQAGTADNAYDVVMSNIPFGDLSVTDKTWKHDSSPVRKAAQNRIHNYFAVKMLDNTRPGGLCVIMTSNAILDTKSNQIIREHLASQAEVLGAVRLPDNTFKGAGTSVVTDVIFLRKFKDEADRTVTRGNEAYTTNIEKPFLSSGELKLKNPTDGKTYKVAVNGYFAKNKDMMIGDGKAGGQYRADEFGLSSTMGTDDISKTMGKLVEKKIVGDRKGKLFDTHKTEREVKQAVSEAYKGDGNYISSGNIVEQDGMIGVVTSTKNKYGDVTTTFNEMPSLKSKADRILAMFPVRKAMKQLIDMQIQGENEHNLSEARAELQKAYDEFVKKYGRLNDKGNDFLTEDIDGYTLRSLEKYDDSKFAGLSDIFTKNTIKPALDMTTARTPQDAISLSLAEYGEIKPSFMKDVLGESWAEQCGEMLFRTPFTEDEYETADAYLSGDVKTKLEQARAAVKEDAYLQRNVEALEAVQPKDIPFEDISIRMGARWVPAKVYTDFMYEQFGIQKYEYRGNKSGVEYLPEVDQYVVNVDRKELGGEADAWRTSRRSASEVFTAALQDKSLSVYDTVREGGRETKVLNKEETELLNNKIQDLRTAFEDWIGQQPEREEMLMRLYNDKFNRTVLRKFDGSHLNVAGLMGKELRPHQKDAVWMLINNRGGIVDHIVGAGKTLVMQSAIMEMRRMGIAKKPMIIALKSTVAQIAKEFSEAYPTARILAPVKKEFTAKNRKKYMAQIALNDYDCVILSHDQYNMLPHTEEVERSVIDEQKAQLDNAIEFLYGQADKSQLTKKQIKGLEKRKNNLESKLEKLLDRKTDREFTFEGLGVDYLFVDECQYFKSLPYVSTYDRVAGLGDKKGSQKAIALLNGVRYLQKMHQGDQGTVFLSGTTISNSLSEIYHLLNYLRPSEMERLGMTTFDAWAGNFAIHTAELEYGVTSELKEKDRFRSLTNIPELAKMYAEIADVRNDLNLKLPKPKMRSHIVTVPQTELMREINREIVDMVRSKDGHYFNIASNENTPWGLLASTLSAKAAINPRLIDESWKTEGGKIPAVCENVKKIYDRFADQKGTQLIFCDTGVPGKGKKYDAYSDIINRLVNDYGIPRREIADIHEANTDEKRKVLFAKVNDGSVRILIGGTKNMGTGVNVQKRIVAMHHVDVPWTPADREQREGRGVRQGNEIARDFNDDNVDVYFYATEGSLDMYKYQLQETKGKLFAQFKTGAVGDRTFDEGDAEENFDPAEVVAMLSGNPVIFEKSKQDKKVEKLRRAKRAYESDWQRRHARYEELQTKKSNFERLLSFNAGDVRELERGGFTPDADGKYPTTVTVSVKDDYGSRKTFEKPKEAGAYIHELLKQGKKVQLSGFHQTADICIPVTEAGIFGKPVAELESYGGIKYTVEVSDDDTAAGVAFRNLLQKVYSNRKVYERNIEDVNNQLKGADPGENAFPKQAELDEALKEKKRLDEEYKKLSDEQDKPSADKDFRFRIFGGNKGYVGYSMSKRAAHARDEGRYPKTDFKKEYGVTEKSLEALTDIGMVDTGEWHHTSMYGNRTTFYGWSEPWMSEAYTENKKEIDRLSRERGVENSEAIEKLMDESRAHRGYIAELEEERLHKKRMTELHEQYIRETSKTIPEEIEVSSGAVVHTEEKEWYVTKDGVRLTKRNGKHLRNEAIVEAREILKPDVTFEEWLQKQNDSLQYRNLGKEVNEQFNRELTELTEKNAQSKRLKLGQPSPMLSAAGVPDKPIILYGNKLLKKAKLHNFDVKELHNLPLAMQNPIAVFEGSHPNSFATLLEIKLGGYNTLASIEVNKKGEADFNIISSLFGKESKGITKWILDGKLLSVDKEKAQSYISASALNADATYKNELSSAAKIVKDFVNPSIGGEKLRDGTGSYTDNELSLVNDPAAKMLGKTNRTDAERKAFAERERRRMAGRVKGLADRLHLDNVDVVADSGTLQGRKAKAKGFYSKSSGKITIVIPNHSSVDDAEKTLLHEAVAHYGLRKLFGSHFDTFLDNVFRNVEPQVRRSIVSLSSRNGWDFRTATEEYLAGLAEKTEFENVPNTVWNKIKSLFLKMLHGIGFKDWSGVELGDNELRYLLWRSYENMKEPGRYRSILGEAEDIAKQNELKVGNYAPTEEKALVSVAEETGSVAEGNFLFRDDGGSGETVREIYEKAVKDAGSRTMLGAFAHALASSDGRRRFKNQFAESYFDYSRSIKQLQDAIERGLGTRLESHEDVWRTLNAKGSADAQEVNLAMLRYIAPLAEHIGEMIHGRMLRGKKIIMDDVEAYMNSVHSIERNARMQEASFRDAVMRQLKTEGYDGEERAAIAEAELEKLRKGEGSAYTDLFAAARRDYSGLTALFGDTVEDSGDVALLEEAARRYASEFEESVGQGSTLKFWDMVRVMNDFSLRKSYLSGLISKAQYDSVRKMYKHYVPLRGWHDDYAGDVYQYISRGEHGDLLQDALKKAHGRKSRAGDILGTMAAMANTAIVRGNRNLVAQKFLNMALNHGQQSGLLMVGRQWYEENADGDLVPLYPKLHDGMTLEQQQSEIERFEAEMKAKEKSGEVQVMRRDFNKEMSLNMPKWEEREHCVRVLRNGVEYQVYVLGNPRAAQAFNGLLTKQSDAGVIAEEWANLMRLKATMQTSLSPEFIFSNFQRDILTAGTGTYIKFGRKAGVAFAKNLAAVNPMAGISDGRIGGIFTLLRRYEQRRLNMDNDMERMFCEFVRNGGMTGVSVIEGKDEYQKSIEKAVKRIGRGKLDMPRKALHEIADAVEFLNSGIENATRFAAYMVSRQTLRKSVTESIFDAKEASVNFNMKGSGHWGNLWLRRNILYSNPAIQSLRMLGTWYEASPKRFMSSISAILAMSVGMAMLWASVGAGVSDDDNDWYKLSEWNRYNYINFRTRHGYAHWSLPQEIRPVWALGQIVFDWQCGMITGERAINSMVTQLNNLSPMAFFSGGMDSKDSYWKTAVRAWTPTILADLTDAYLWNENFLGQKITNQEDYNVDSPEYRRSGRNTPQWAVDLSRMWNSVTGGAPNRKSYWDGPALNPSALYYLLQQQSGGLGIIVTKLSKAYEQLEDPDVDVEAKNIPFVSKVWVSTEDKQSVNRVVDDKFWLIYNDWKLTDSEIRHNRSDVESGKMTLMEFAERMGELRRSGDYGRWAALNGIMKSYGKLRSAERDGKDIDDAVRRLKKDVVSIDGMNKTRK